MMFRSYSNTFEQFLRDYVAKAIVIMLFPRVKQHVIFTCGDMFTRESSPGISLVFI